VGLFVLRRLLLSVPVLFVATVITFFGVSVVGDPLAQLHMIPDVSQATIENFIARNRLDEPLIVQYGVWLKSVVTDQFGRNFGGEPIWPRMRVALYFTLQLMIAAELLALLVGVALGVISAKRQYSVTDYTTTTISFLGYSLPIFWFGLILIVMATSLFQATGVRVFYTSVAGISSPEVVGWDAYAVEWLQRFTLPIIALSFTSVALYSRFMRSSMLEILGADYVRTARAKGLRERLVSRKHAMRNALIPIATLAALNFATVFSGAIIVENVFAIPGMGRFFIEALGDREVYEVMAFLLVTSVFIIVANLLADIVYGFLDPRIRYD
jgi:peptide/nickel transport system permease protein